jgi:hypothetical protein
MCIQGTEKEIRTSGGKIKSCDVCIQPLIQSLNDVGLETIASCCGHGKQPANIVLKGGREVMIFDDFDTARMVSNLFEPLHPRKGEWKYRIKRLLARLILI